MLFAKFSKCDFWLNSMIFLGYVVSKNGIMVELTKINAIHDLERPISLIKICIFISLASYYRWFTESFATIAPPKARLTQK